MDLAINVEEIRDVAVRKAYNVIIIGASQDALLLASKLSKVGAHVALVEQKYNKKKSTSHSAILSEKIVTSSKFSRFINSGLKHNFFEREKGVDFNKLLEYVKDQKKKFKQVSFDNYFYGLDVDIYYGNARFLTPFKIEVNGECLESKKIVIATGTCPSFPDIDGLSDVEYYYNEGIFDELKEKPESIAILGGGSLGCELTQIFKIVGVEVYLIECADQILKEEDSEIAEILNNKLKDDGIHLYLKTNIKKIYRREGQKVLVMRDAAGKEKELMVDVLFLATGRMPDISELDLELAGVNFSERGIVINEYLQTSQSHIYGLGSVSENGKNPLISRYQVDIILENIVRALLIPIKLPNWIVFKKAKSKVLPWCTYTSPEIVRIGLNELEAVDKMSYNVCYLDASECKKISPKSLGIQFLKLVTKRHSDCVMGVSIIGERVSTILQKMLTVMEYDSSLKKMLEVLNIDTSSLGMLKKRGGFYKKKRMVKSFVRLVKRRFTRELDTK